MKPWVQQWVLENVQQFEAENNILTENMAAVHIRRGDKVYGSEFNNPEMGYISSYKLIHTLTG
jgi:hypothetical protein